MADNTITKDPTAVVLHPDHPTPTAEQIMAAITAIDTIIQSTASETLALKKVMNKVFHLFQCDRAWLYFPCNPEAESFKVVYETTHPDFTGAKALNTDIPMTGDVARNCRRALADPFAAMIYHPGENQHITSILASGFQIQSMLFMAVQPRIGDAWMFGLHQCDHPRAWHPDELQLFQIIGHRIADLLSHKLYADRLNESEDRYHKALEMAPYPIFVHRNGKFLYVNPATVKLLGFQKKADLIGRSSIAFVDQSLIKTVWERIEQCNHQKQALPFIELKLHRPDGKVVYIESATIQTMYDGEPAAQVFARDVTDLKQTIEQFQLFVENSIEEIWQLDTEGNLVYVSPAVEKIFGYTVEEALSLHFKSFFPEKSLSQTSNLFSKVLSGETVQSVKLTGLRKDGQEIPIEASVMPVRKGNIIIGVQGIARDISERLKAEAALRDSENRYRLLAENMSDVLFLINEKMRLIYFSPSVQRLLGYTPEEMLTLPLEAYISPEFIAPVLAHTEKRLALEREGRGDDKSRTWILQYICKDGRPIWGELVTTPMRHKDGSFSGLIGVIRDIDERKQTQDALKASETRYKTLFDRINSGVAVYQAVDDGADFIFLEFNNAGQDIEQVDKELVIGRSVLDVFPGVRDFGIFEVFQRVWRTGVPEHFPVALYQDTRIAGWRDSFVYKLPTGEIVTVYTDETERQQNIRKLQESEERLRTILESVQTGIVIIDPQVHRIVEINSTAAAMIGTDRQHIIGKVCHNFICPAQPGECPITDLDGPHDQSEQVLLRANGESIPVLKTVSAITIDGKPHLLANIVDISERKQLEARLRHAQKMESIGSLAGGIAHDFNNILFPIVGMAELLLDDLPHGSAERMQVRQILKAGLRASDLVNQILAFSRQSETKMIPLCPEQILKDVISLCRATIPADIPITEEFQGNCGVIMADPTQLHQIAMNLITNAYHAVESNKGRITVKLEKITITQDNVPKKNIEPGLWVRLSIIDTGCGIEPQVLERIFEPYFTTKARGKGTGLGLAVVYGLVKDHGGEIKTISQVNKGTTMEVYFPVVESSEEEVLHPEEEQYLTGSETILLVDDEAPIVELERMILERCGYCVKTCTSSIDALVIFRNNPDQFDLVITDMTMPNMTGEQLAQAILRIRPAMPVIICTGFSERIDSQIAEALGIKGYLSKPVVKSELTRMVRNVLDDARY